MKPVFCLLNIGRRYRYQYTVCGFLAWLLAALAVSGVIILCILREWWWPSGVLGVVLIGIVFCWLRPGGINAKEIRRRERFLGAMTRAGKNASQKSPGLSATMKKLGYQELESMQSVSDLDWRFGDFTYVKRCGIRRGLVAERRYFSCIEVQLPQKLPAKLLLSRHSGHKIWPRINREKFARLQLGDELKKHFEAFGRIKSQQSEEFFVSSELAQAILALREYHIEISGSRLFLYGPLTSENQIKPTIKSAIHLARQLVKSSIQ